MTTELLYLTLVSLLTALQFLLYTNSLILKHGLGAAVGNRDQTFPLPAWAERAKRAHANAVENLVVFAAVVLVAHVAGKHTGATATAAMVYFWARLVYVAVYTAGIIWARTIVWFVGWLAMIVIIWQILA